MPSQKAIQALIELRRKQQQNQTAPSLVTDYNFDKPNETIQDLIQEEWTSKKNIKVYLIK